MSSTFDIQLERGDTENKNFILTINNTGVDLTSYQVVFNMRMVNNTTVQYVITCLPGIKTPSNLGGGIIPFAPIYTSKPGEFIGKFVITDVNGRSLKFPLASDIHVKIYEGG